MGYRPEFFSLQELVNPVLFSTVDHEKLWYVLDPSMLQQLDLLRKRFGAITINNWYTGGTLQNCGLRPFDSDVGKPYSLHKFGRAFDLHFQSHSSDEIRIIIRMFLNDPEFRYITCIEEDVAWLHIDNRNHVQPNRIMFVKP